jgi:virginiamycin B lyase
MALTAADLPKELGAWKLVGGRVVDNASFGQAHAMTLSNVVATGRLTGYQEAFVVHPVSLSAGGKRKLLLPNLDLVVSRIDVYDSAASAQTAFAGVGSGSFRAVPTSARIGSRTALYQGTLPSPYPSVVLGSQHAWAVKWVDGAVVAAVGVAGLLPSAKDALALARADERSIVAQVTGLVSPVVSGRMRIYADPRIVDPQEIAAGPDGALWFTNGSKSVGRITTDGRLSIYTDRRINNPETIVAGPDGALWFTNAGGNSIGRISTDGQLTSFTDPSMNQPYGITVGPDGALWFTNFSGTSIGRITTDGTVTSYADGEVSLAEGITAGPDGALWIAEHGAIVRLSTNGKTRFFAGPNTDPDGVTTGPDGALWYSGLGGGIGRVTTSGRISTIDPEIGYSWGIVAGPDGALWFTEGGAIGRITTQGQVQTFTSPVQPFGITVGPDGALWFTSRGAIGRISTT